MKNKLKVLKPKLTKELAKYIQESYYDKDQIKIKVRTEQQMGKTVKLVHYVKRAKPVKSTNATSKTILGFYGTVSDLQEKHEHGRLNLKGATYVPIDNEIKTLPDARKHFVDITYPQKTIIAEPMRKKLGVQEIIFKSHKGQKNCVRYYTAKMQQKLTEKQCSVLYLDEEIRSTFGFLINDKPISNNFLVSYIVYVDTLGKIAEARSKLLQQQQVYQREQRTLNTMFNELSSKVKTNPDGSRRPIVIQLGVNSYMTRNKLTNPVEIIDVHAKGKDKIKVYDFKNLSSLLQEINVNPQEAFDYVTKYLNKNRDIKRIHTQDREEARGGTALRNLVEFFDAEVERTTKHKKTDRKTKVFTYTMLMESKEFADYCKVVKDTPANLWTYDKFKRWFRHKLIVYAKLQKIK